MASPSVHPLVPGTSAASGTSSMFQAEALNRTYQVVISSAATVNLQASLDGTNWETLRTSTASEMFSTAEPWKYLRVTWSGNDGTVTFLVGS